MKKNGSLVISQILSHSPILKEMEYVRKLYFAYLKQLLSYVNWRKNKYTVAQLSYYQEVLCEGKCDVKWKRGDIIIKKYWNLIPFDIAILCGLNPKLKNKTKIKRIIEKICSDLMLTKYQAIYLKRAFNHVSREEINWEDLLKDSQSKGIKKYINLVKKNIDFMSTESLDILITATMSAGKSTLINALVGKNISLMQNMACTSKIHTIISKPFDDGITSEFDYELLLNATQDDLLDDNEENKSSNITVGTYFNSNLGGKRIVLHDSPGVNSSENDEHTLISEQMIKSRNYDLVLYVLNATQLGTNDELKHLNMVKNIIGRTKIIFVLNKVDQLISDDDNISLVIENQRRFLISNGFKNPTICPVSSRAVYLYKKSKLQSLSRIEQRELYKYMDCFAENKLDEYYCNQFNMVIKQFRDEGLLLCSNSGFSYLEQIIENIYEGGC